MYYDWTIEQFIDSKYYFSHNNYDSYVLFNHGQIIDKLTEDKIILDFTNNKEDFNVYIEEERWTLKWFHISGSVFIFLITSFGVFRKLIEE